MLRSGKNVGSGKQLGIEAGYMHIYQKNFCACGYMDAYS